MKNKDNKKNEVMMDKGFKIPKWILVVLVLNLAGVIGIGTLLLSKQKKTAFVDLGKLYDGFEFSKQKQAEFQSMNFQFKNSLDSLGLQIKKLEESLNQKYDVEIDHELQRRKDNFYQIEANMQQKLQEEKAKYDEQIWQQINSYTQEFGKEKGYDFIYGGNGSGSLMYANDSKDISEDVLAYINKKYSGE